MAAGLRTTAPLAGDAAEVVSGMLAYPSTEVVEMSAFGECEIAAFINERLARRPSDDEVALLVRRSGGIPFLLGELLRWDAGDARPASRRFSTASLTCVASPTAPSAPKSKRSTPVTPASSWWSPATGPRSTGNRSTAPGPPRHRRRRPHPHGHCPLASLLTKRHLGLTEQL